jgi:hypothetical protein
MRQVAFHLPTPAIRHAVTHWDDGDPDRDQAVERERWQEIATLVRAGCPPLLLHGTGPGGVVLGGFTVHGEPLHLTTLSGDPVAMPTAPVLLRCGANAHRLQRALADLGMPLAVSAADDAVVTHWASWMDAAWTGRQMAVVSLSALRRWVGEADDLPANPAEDAAIARVAGAHPMVFVKTLHKAAHGLVRTATAHRGMDLFGALQGQTEMGDPRMPVILSEPLVIATDDLPCCTQEWRLYVIDRRVVHASRADDDHTYPVPQEILQRGQAIIDACRCPALPDHVVLDLARTDRGLVVVELNPISGSGRYRGNDPARLYGAWLRADADLQRRLDQAWASVQADDARRAAVARARVDAQRGAGLLGGGPAL